MTDEITVKQEKYAIVRVDNWDKCPSELNEIKKDFICELSCEECRYGDTKEHLIRKVAQIRFKQETQYGSKDMLKAIYNMCYRQAREIIEFLGVEDERKISKNY